MKKILALWLLFFCGFIAIAQPIPPQSIEDSVLGWMKVYHFKGAKEPKKVDDKLYSIAQLSIIDTLANWMQASYMPKGGWGDIKKSVSGKLGLYNQYDAARPQSYGAYAKTYSELKYNASHKMELYTDSHIYWGIYANGVPGSWAVRDLCTPEQFYFVLPTSETQVDDVKIKTILDLSDEPTVKPYITFWLENMGYGGGTENVLLCKDNKSPFVPITKGEYFQALEVGIARFYELEKKKISEREQGDKERINVAVKDLDEKIARFHLGLKSNKEKYMNRLEELAMASSQPSLMDLDNGRDIFSNGYLTDTESVTGRLPVYKVDPVMAELCKKDKPQWILITWDYWISDRLEKQQHDAIINNFNFEYVYNFFFAPEKVKGQPYKPLRSPVYKEAAVATESSTITKKNSADKSVHFYEDFSTSGLNKAPIGWRADMNVNGSSVVTKLDGADGNWVVVAGDRIVPTSLKKPLPQNFSLSYDLIACEGFKWGGYGLTVNLAKETSPGNAESYLKLKLRPGSDGRDGEVTLETKFPVPAGYSNETKWFVAKGFSNNNKINRVSVMINKTDEKLQVFIENTKIVELEKAIPAAHLFNALSFNGGTTDGDKFYLSNIKMTRN
jgi:hypothetical protein